MPRFWRCGCAASSAAACWRRTTAASPASSASASGRWKRARAEAEASEARARLADAQERANRDLADANRQITEAQAKLVQAAKMASLGELVAGIAHEINNPLAFILAHQGTVERLLNELPSAAPEAASRALDKARQRVGSMRMGLTRIQDLVLNLRKFSRLDEGERGPGQRGQRRSRPCWR